VLPDGTRGFKLKARAYLTSYRICSDVRRAIQNLENELPTFGAWHVEWAGICALLKASIHVMKVDARRCYSAELQQSLLRGWKRLADQKSAYPLMWDFIDKERNNILKEYSFSAYDEYIKEDGTTVDFVSLFDLGTSRHLLRIRMGPYAGRIALEVAGEAVAWIEEYLDQCILEAGIDPDEEFEWGTFLK